MKSIRYITFSFLSIAFTLSLVSIALFNATPAFAVMAIDADGGSGGGQTTYPAVAPYCGDGAVNQSWEQCDGGASCTAQCLPTDPTQCTDIVLAKVTITNVQNLDTTPPSQIVFGGSCSTAYFPIAGQGGALACLSKGTACLAGAMTRATHSGAFCGSISAADSSTDGASVTFDLSTRLQGVTGSAAVVIPLSVWDGIRTQSEADVVLKNDNLASIPSAFAGATDFSTQAQPRAEILRIPDVSQDATLVIDGPLTYIPCGEDCGNYPHLRVNYSAASKSLTVDFGKGGRWKKHWPWPAGYGPWNIQHYQGWYNGKVWSEVRVVTPAPDGVGQTGTLTPPTGGGGGGGRQGPINTDLVISNFIHTTLTFAQSFFTAGTAYAGTTGNMTSAIFLGSASNSIPSGTWFPVYASGAYISDPAIDGYENVPGLAVQRSQGSVDVRIYGHNIPYILEHVEGTVELSGADITSQVSDAGDNVLENPTNSVKSLTDAEDEVWLSGGKSNFWMTTGAADDGFSTNYTKTISCPLSPTATLSASPMTITQGGSSTVSWSSTDATSCTGTNFSTGGTPSGSTSVSPSSTTTYGLSCTGPGGTATDSKTVTVNYNAPTCTLSASPYSLLYGGGSTTLSWVSANATSITIDQGVGAVTPVASGSKSVSVASTIAFTATVTGPGGSVECSKTVRVAGPSAPTATLSASPMTITQGGSSTVSWSSTDATSCTGTNFSTGGTPSGSTSVSPSSTTTYGLSCTGPGGTATDSKTVTVNAPVVGCRLVISKTADKTNAAPGDLVQYTLNFSNTGDRDCTGGGVKIADALDPGLTYVSETHSSNITPGYGSDPVYKSYDRTVRFNGNTLNPGESGWLKINLRAATPAQCSVTVPNMAMITSAEYNNFGTWVLSNTVSLAVAKDCTPPPTATLSASPMTITQGGSSTVSWSSTDATSCTGTNFSTGGTPSGSTSVSPSSTTTYGLSCSGPGGTATDSKTVTVNAPQPAPTCTLSATSCNYSGKNVTLTWTTTNATSITIDQGIGPVTPVRRGSKNLLVQTTTTFTATVTGPGGTAQCAERVYVGSKRRH